MRFTKPALIAAIAAAIGGVGGTQLIDRNTVGISDQVEIVLNASSSPTPAPTPAKEFELDPAPSDAPTPAISYEEHGSDLAEPEDIAELEERFPDEVRILRQNLAEHAEFRRRAGTLDVLANAEIRKYDGDHHLLDYRVLHNTLVDIGKLNAIELLVGAASGSCPSVACGVSGACANPPKWNWVGIGTGTGSTVAGTTSCSGEPTPGAGYGRVQDTVPDVISNSSRRLIVTFGAGNATGAITEACLFNAQTGTTALLARQVFSAVTKGASDSIQVSWTISIA